MSAIPTSLVKIVSGRSLARKDSPLLTENKTRSSSAESHAKISLKNIILRKSKENLIPKDKIPTKPRGSITKLPILQKLDLNLKDITNSFYRRLTELEPKLAHYQSQTLPTDLISPTKSRY